jgi:hypothetical protein
VQAKFVNSNKMDDTLIAFNIVLLIMPGLSGSVSEEGKVSVIIKALFSR